MERQTKITILWIVVMCGLAIHSLADLMPLFWSENIAVSQDGQAPTGMLVFMMTITYLIPVSGILCTMSWSGRHGNMVNAILATIMALFNSAHCFEMVDFNPVQLPLLPVTMIVSWILCILCWNEVKSHRNLK